MFIASMLAVGAPPADNVSGELEQGFQSPPDPAKPRVWWHWMNGNISKEGIKLDLEWMKRVGIGGFQNFDAGINTPQLVDKRLVYMTPEWKDAFKYTAELADKMGFEMAIAASPGWSETGGPWVKPEEGMKKYVWGETRIEGGKAFSGTLNPPPGTTGPFQNIPRGGLADLLAGKELEQGPEHYADIATIAYKLPEGIPADAAKPKVTSSGGSIDASLLADGDFVQSITLPAAPVGETAWIQFEYPEARTIRALTLSSSAGNAYGGAAGKGPELESSDDGKTWKIVTTLPLVPNILRTVAFPDTTARYFRLSFTTWEPGPMRDFWLLLGIPAPVPPTEFKITELCLHTEPRINYFEDKTGFATGFSTEGDLYEHPTPPLPENVAIKLADIIDLTSKVKADGSLEWTPPAGQWVVLRLGYSLTGRTNHPASPEATGLEVDKLNRKFVKDYLDEYFKLYEDASGGLMGKRGLQAIITDSWEAGFQNWTDAFPAEFKTRRGYDLRTWLAVLAGRVVESSQASDKFLWDFRQTIAELTADEHYDQVSRSAHERDLIYYSESHESHRAFVGDGMAVKRNADVPMGAIWTQIPGEDVMEPDPVYDADVKESASVAHIYGQNLAAAESLTAGSGPYGWSPRNLKPTADKALAMGLNRYVIHTSAHQPLVGKAPGVGLGPFGQWFTRNETWAEQAEPWVSYLSRSCYMLQKGRYIADVLYYYGEDTNITSIFRKKGPEIPCGYDYDYVNSDALLNMFSVEDGCIVTKSGMCYRLLALHPRTKISSLQILKVIRELVKAGAVVSGPKPEATPSLSDDEAEFRKIVDELWGDGTGETSVGKGKVLGGKSVGDALESLGVALDVEYKNAKSDTNMFFVHRALEGADLYFLNNRTNREEALDVTFRVEGREAEYWHAETGETKPASYTIKDGRTTVSVTLEPWGSVFVVFRTKAKENTRTLPKRSEKELATVDGAWEVSFDPQWGGPEQATFDTLTPWNEHQDDGVKYFSGTATYSKTIEVSKEALDGNKEVWLDLGDVRELADVSVNEQSLGIVWHAPFRINATKALKPGANTVEIKVTNLWVNRLIGDAQPDAKQHTLSHIKFFKAEDPLVKSGLIGPVKLVGITEG